MAEEDVVTENVIPRCIPYNNATYKKQDQVCPFSGWKLYDYEELVEQGVKLKELVDIRSDLTDQEESELSDWLDEFKMVKIPAGTQLVHSSHPGYILTANRYNPKTLCWWNKTFPGQRNYGGGWFTMMSSFGGPGFGMNIYYITQKDCYLIWIPNTYRESYIQKYIPELIGVNLDQWVKDYKKIYERGESPTPEQSRQYIHVDKVQKFQSSHLIEGVEGWQEKYYDPLSLDYFADGLGIRMGQLGLNGYISCDECEIFITHQAMKNGVLSFPDRVELIHGEGDMIGKEEYRAIWEHMISTCWPPEVKELTVTQMESRPTSKFVNDYDDPRYRGPPMTRAMKLENEGWIVIPGMEEYDPNSVEKKVINGRTVTRPSTRTRAGNRPKVYSTNEVKQTILPPLGTDRDTITKWMTENLLNPVRKARQGRSKYFIISYGPPGSGKSIQYIPSQIWTRTPGLNPKDLVNVNVDDLMEKLIPEYRQSMENKDSNLSSIYQQFRPQGNKYSDELTEMAIQNSYNILWETTGSNQSWIEHMIKRVKRYGYTVVILYPLVPLDILSTRVYERHLTTGKVEVSVYTLSNMMSVAAKNFTKLIGIVDKAYVYDNSNTRPNVAMVISMDSPGSIICMNETNQVISEYVDTAVDQMFYMICGRSAVK